MTLQVIGSGFGRTGTMTMKLALGELGFAPCYHMIEVMENPGHLAHWKAVFAGEQVDWADVYEGYAAQVDWPGAFAWHEASIAFPEARVIHTERPEEDWWNSFNSTIGKFFALSDTIPLPPYLADVLATMKAGILPEDLRRLHRPPERHRRLSGEQRKGARHHPRGPAAGLQRRRGLGAALPVPRGAGARHALPAHPRAQGVLGAFRRRA